MKASTFINNYFRERSEVIRSKATEHSYRTSLENLLKGIARSPEFSEQSEKVTVMQEAKHDEDGQPDFKVYNQGEAIVGCVECKKRGASVDKEIGGTQLTKYRNISENMLVTNYWEFVRVDGEKEMGRVKFVQGKKPTLKQKNALKDIIIEFLGAEIRPIDNPKSLANILARRCKALRDEIVKELSDENKGNETAKRLATLQSAYKTTLHHDMTVDTFANDLAQTVIYSLLMAKLLNENVDKKIDSIRQLSEYIPNGHKLIKGISRFLEHMDDTPLKTHLDDVLMVINAVDALALKKKAKVSAEEDLYFYFYEDFLSAYDAKLRKDCGVYYTPKSAVKYIVGVTDHILRDVFNKTDGVASKGVVALDFAAGTGTFMMEMFRLTLANLKKSKKIVGILSRKRLVNNICGFELLVAPYVIAHLKLSEFLTTNGIEMSGDERIKLYLTNTLEEHKEQKVFPTIIPEMTDEMEDAGKVKQEKIIVITGNPPYKGHSKTNNDYTKRLLKAYYQVDNVKVKDTKWLRGDYVKFIAFAESKIAESKQGIVAIITNHGFLDNNTFPGMRQSLLTTFDQLYVLNLHGNVKKREVAPNGEKDTGLFKNIEMGVSISFLVKKEGLEKGVFHADLWGARESKEKKLTEMAECPAKWKESILWKPIKPESDTYLFIPQNNKRAREYRKLYSLKDIFSVSSSGCITCLDPVAMRLSREDMKSTAKKFASMPTEEARTHYELNEDVQERKLEDHQRELNETKMLEENFRTMSYRPFDVRHTYYTGKPGFINGPRYKIMRHMMGGGNLGLIAAHRVTGLPWRHVFITDDIMEGSYFAGGVAFLFPLRIWEKEVIGKKTDFVENFKKPFRKWINEHYGKEHTAEDILSCIYAVMHSPKYRELYAENVKQDFARIPFPKDNKAFARYVKIGEGLIAAHLGLDESDCGTEIQVVGNGTYSVDKGNVRYDEKEQRLYFNESQYLESLPPDVYNFMIGKHQPLFKFLDYRKETNIEDEIEALEKAANAIAYTIRVMKDIPLP